MSSKGTLYHYPQCKTSFTCHISKLTAEKTITLKTIVIQIHPIFLPLLSFQKKESIQ